MLETKILRVHRYEESACMEAQSRFGWIVQSTEDTTIVENDRRYYGTKINFVRDTSMPKYARLAEIEKEYEALKEAQPKWTPVAIVFGFIFYIIPGIIYCVCKSKQIKKWKETGLVKERALLEEAKEIITAAQEGSI